MQLLKQTSSVVLRRPLKLRSLRALAAGITRINLATLINSIPFQVHLNQLGTKQYKNGGVVMLKWAQ